MLLLENVRFYEEETKNDSEFAQKLASLADLYVNDAFGAAHRAHASTEGITHYFDQCARGFADGTGKLNISAECSTIQSAPFVTILGGCKDFGQNRRD